MALEIFRLVGSVFVDTDAANKSLKNTDKEAEQLAHSLSEGVKKVGTFVKNVATTAVAVGAGIVALTESTREYRTEQGKLQTAFETQNFSAEAARKTYEELNGILGDSGQAVEAANHLAMLADNEKELAEWTNIATGVYATFGDSLPIENLTEAANETAKTGALTGGLADALNWAGVNEDKFQESLDKCANEQERQALITDTLNGLYTEAADKYREVNGEVIAANKAQDKMNKAMADIGKALEPVVTKGKELAAEVLEKATPLITNLGEIAVPLLAGAFDLLVDALNWVVDLFTDVSGFLAEHPNLMTVLAVAVGTLTTALIAYNIAQKAAAIATLITTTATTAWGAAVAFLTSPITLTIAAIGALIAIVVLLVKNWDDVKKFALACWEGIKKAWGVAGEWFKTKIVDPVVKFFKQLDKDVRKAFSDAWAGVQNAWKGAGQWFKGIWTDCKNAFGNVADWFKNVFTKAWQGVKNVFSTGGKIFDGIKTGIENVFKKTVNAIIRGINRVIAFPFNKINGILDRLRNISIMKIKPFTWIGSLSVPQIPELYEGAVLERGQVGLLEGNGAEAVVPLHRNKQWISAVARDMDSAIGGGSGSQIIALLMDILEAIEEIAEMGIFLDKDKLVGELAKPMDKKLGQLQAKKART